VKRISAVIIDTFPNKVIPLLATRRTSRLPNFLKLYTLFDEPFVAGAEFHKIEPIRSLTQYSDTVLRVLPSVVQEEHFLLIQWDGMPVSPAHWDDAFLQYDYIGAPWAGQPPQFAVGNGGFSLRSRRLLDAIRSLGITADPSDPIHHAEDMLICRTHRARLEQMGIKFAPLEVARRFSFETGSPTKAVFGFHSTENFPLFFSEDELLGFSQEIVARQSTLKIVLNYLERLLQMGMHDLLRLTIGAIHASAPLDAAIRRTFKSVPPHYRIATVLNQEFGVSSVIRLSASFQSAGAVCQ
jgi:hypothetical protein